MVQIGPPKKVIHTRNDLELMLKKTIHMVYPNLFALVVHMVLGQKMVQHKVII